MTALWAYGSEHFEQFDASVCDLLRRGLHTPTRGAQGLSQLACNAISGTLTTGSARIARTRGRPPARGWASRGGTFEGLLRNVLADRRLGSQRHADGLDVVITACELQTASAFRFGDHRGVVLGVVCNGVGEGAHRSHGLGRQRDVRCARVTQGRDRELREQDGGMRHVGRLFA
jgi:hypothetical protein